MAAHILFEVSWEVCNRLGGIHTTVATKAKTLVDRFGDDYVVIGPWRLSGDERQPPFVEEPGYQAFADACRAAGVPVRVGRWAIAGRPLTVLVESSKLLERKDEIFSKLWEVHGVDSLFGAWDYVEPVLFGLAAGMVIERWFQESGGQRSSAVAQFHEWMTGSGALYLKEHVPAIGTVFTAHATVLGRAIAARGARPADGLSDRKPDEVAGDLDVRSQHSLESACARGADVFTAISDIVSTEAELFFGRRADLLLPNGISIDVIDEFAGPTPAHAAATALRTLAGRFLGENVDAAALVCISGRYEFHNKGIDLVLDAAARLAEGPGRQIVLFVIVPAGNSGVRAEVLQRLREEQRDGPGLGISTHNLFDAEHDAIQQRCRELGLDNAPTKRVKVIQLPCYLRSGDGLLNLPYEAVLRAFDLTCFPSFYEPWGYTPEESLALGVPTITTDCSGFGAWIKAQGLGAADGVHVIARQNVTHETARDELVRVIEQQLSRLDDRQTLAATCRRTAQATAWSDLIQNYEAAFQRAHAAAGARIEGGRARFRPRVTAVRVTPTAVGQRPHLSRFSVAPTIPAALKGLETLARNLWWTYDHEARSLFRDLSPRRFAACRHNPVAMLRQVFAADLEQRAADQGYVARLEHTMQRLEDFLQQEPPARPGIDRRHPVAYFCAEFGIHESVPIYSGGLGILAGDHLKSASDLNLPLVGVGLFYRKGYLTQQLSQAQEQLALEVDNDPASLPLEPVLDDQGDPLELSLPLPSSALTLRAWRLRVGRVSLYLLDSDLPANRPEDRGITHQLYGGDQENRLRQEIVLGRGGVRLLQRLAIEPGAWHLNEGHAAFVGIERVAGLVRAGRTFDEARLLIRATTVFTTHTPIPAGHDRFPEALMRRYFSDVDQWAGVPWERFFGFGGGADGQFNMTWLANHFAGFVNGVSKLHGEVSRGILAPAWPMLLPVEVPVASVTNGVHLPSWTHPAIGRLLGAAGRCVTAADFERADKVPLRELWGVRSQLKTELKDAARSRIERSFLRRHDSPALLDRMLAGLEGDALWIGFARRFVPYKRADLLMRDLPRLERLLGDKARPVRLVFAGKAHPHDREGQDILRRVAELTRSDAFVGRIHFVEDYDIELARHLVAGVDIWLNNPIRPLEASGTSGMKAAANGALNLSIADGWWVEGADGRNGWTIGSSQVLPSKQLQDEMDSAHLYRLLEDTIVPLYFERDQDVPTRWLERAREALRTIAPVFDSARMLREYQELAYSPAGRSRKELCTGEDNLHLRHEEHRRIRRGFGEVRILAADVTDLADFKVGETIDAEVTVDLGSLRPGDVVVELVLGHLRGETDLHKPVLVTLQPLPGEGRCRRFAGAHLIDRSGAHAYGIRVRAAIREVWDRVLMDLVLWAG